MGSVFEQELTVEQWDEEYYPPLATRLYDKAIPQMLRDMGAEPGATVLDAGCGPGVHSIRAARAGCHVCAIDISETMLGHARRRVAAQGLEKSVEFRRMDLTRLDYPDASFRHVFSWGVVIHIPEAQRAFAELARIVQPGGTLALYLTNKSALDHRIEPIARALLRRPGPEVQRLSLGEGRWYDMQSEKIWVWRFDAAAVTDYLEKRGFQLVKRRIGELSEIQLKLGGIARDVLLHLNNLAYDLNVPARFATGQMLVFRKSGAPAR
jgi:ubiquinone/menaquinone biosynthesis C-methylase UbiE